MKKTIIAHNPNNLPLIHYSDLCDFQGDFKADIGAEQLKKLKNSIIKHDIFIPKFVWFDPDGRACILDGHQTKKALKSLEDDGWEIPMIPYVKVDARDRQDAAEKLLQINSRYAKVNPESDFIRSLDDIGEILQQVEIPEIKIPDVDVSDVVASIDHVDKIEESFSILIECKSESQQIELLERLESEGVKCKALIS